MTEGSFAPNWLLMFYEDDQCPKCQAFKSDFDLMAEVLQESEGQYKEHEYLVARVNCKAPGSM